MKEYEVIIVGCGPAGMACAISLCKQEKRVLILESREAITGKVCGDGLTVRAIKDLKKIGIDPSALEGKKVFKKVEYKDDRSTTNSFRDLFDFEYEYGISRDVLDKCMLDLAISCGARVIFNQKVSNIKKIDDRYCVNGLYIGKEIVLACGAIGGGPLGGVKRPQNVPVGMSSRVIGRCDYPNDSFHYFYSDAYGDGYAWLFPVGDNLWNVGVWSSNRKDIKKLYELFEKKVFVGEYEYERAPKGALIGATNMKNEKKSEYICIGDCAYNADYYTGEGVSIAIEDGITVAERIIDYL